jgi:acyl carrier protein
VSGDLQPVPERGDPVLRSLGIRLERSARFRCRATSASRLRIPPRPHCIRLRVTAISLEPLARLAVLCAPTRAPASSLVPEFDVGREDPYSSCPVSHMFYSLRGAITVLGASMTEIADTLERFILTEVASGRGLDSIAPEDDLIGMGIVDSLGIEQLVSFLESRYGIAVEDEDLLPENFRTLSRLEAFVNARLSDRPARERKLRRSRWG